MNIDLGIRSYLLTIVVTGVLTFPSPVYAAPGDTPGPSPEPSPQKIIAKKVGTEISTKSPLNKEQKGPGSSLKHNTPVPPTTVNQKPGPNPKENTPGPPVKEGGDSASKTIVKKKAAQGVVPARPGNIPVDTPSTNQ